MTGYVVIVFVESSGRLMASCLLVRSCIVVFSGSVYVLYYYYWYFSTSCSGLLVVVLVVSVVGMASIIILVGRALGAVTVRFCNLRSTSICSVVGSTASFPPTMFA